MDGYGPCLKVIFGKNIILNSKYLENVYLKIKEKFWT